VNREQTSTKGACEAFALGIKTRLGQNIDEVMRLEALDDGDTPQVTTWANEIAHLQSVQSSRHYGNAPSRGNMNGTSSRTDHNKTSSFLASSATPTEAKPEWGVRLLQFLYALKLLCERAVPQAFKHCPFALRYLLCLGGTQREKELFLEQPHASVSVNLLDTFVEYLRTFVGAFLDSSCKAKACSTHSHFVFERQILCEQIRSQDHCCDSESSPLSVGWSLRGEHCIPGALSWPNRCS